MWPKIHSNRDPRDTLFKEIHKEFSPYFQKGGQWGVSWLRSHPKTALYGMITVLLVSLVVSFTLFRNHEKVAVVTVMQVSAVKDGFGQIIRASGKIRETIALKAQVDSLSALKTLSSRDSARLIATLDRLQHLSKL